MTNFMEFLPGYSLTGIVKDQITMLKRHLFEPHLFVSEKYNGEEFAPGIPVHKKVPFSHLRDYTSKKDISSEHKMTAKATAKMLIDECSDFDAIFTHDWIFTGWNYPYGLACQIAAPTMDKPRWFHWVHSVPSGGRDYWEIKAYGKAKLIFPNRTDAIVAAENFKGEINDVRVIPHIKDIRTFWDFHKETWDIIDKMPNLMQADIVQILPASADRLTAKRVKEVISIFGHLSRHAKKVCLLVANQWATERQHKEDVSKYLKHAEACGLIPGQEVAFTSEILPEYSVGVPKEILRELFLLGNLFVFPTKEESFGLVVPEAALHGVELILNRSLPMQMEVAGNNAQFFDFGSYRHEHHLSNPDKYFADIAQIIAGIMLRDSSIRAKTFARRAYNMDTLFNDYYWPILGESKTW